jgi:predicted aspartyl protease
MKYYLYALLLLVTGACANHASQNVIEEMPHPNRLPFCIDSTGGSIIVPVKINDTIIANMFFDTGAPPFILDSTFFFTNNLNANLSIPKMKRITVPFHNKFNVPVLVYKDTSSATIGETDVNHNEMVIINSRSYMDATTNGVFSIPEDDTTHVWELNFDKNYLEIHHYENFQMPEECICLPLYPTNLIPYSLSHEFYIKMPLKIICNEDTLASDHVYMIDTGAFSDIIIPPQAPEAVYFEKNWDNRWRTYYRDGVTIYKENIVQAMTWDTVKIDTLKIYTSDRILHKKKYIGLNFLKRFNVFFDRHHRQICLQPISSYKRYASGLYTLYYYVDTIPTPGGNYKINYIPHFRANYYEAAGLRVGDEIVLWHGYPYGDIVKGKIDLREIYKEKEIDTLVYDIIRGGDSLQILIPVPPKDK